jgi:hemerythrin-like domain-containing protein
MAGRKSSKRDPALIPLSRDHRQSLALCVRLARWKPENDEPPELMAQEVRFQAEQILFPHFELEESVLLPCVKPWLDESEALLSEIIQEHRQLREMLAQMADRSGNSDLVESLKRFGRALEAHIRKEERTLFPLIESRVPEETRSELQSRIEAAPNAT